MTIFVLFYIIDTQPGCTCGRPSWRMRIQSSTSGSTWPRAATTEPGSRSSLESGHAIGPLSSTRNVWWISVASRGQLGNSELEYARSFIRDWLFLSWNIISRRPYWARRCEEYNFSDWFFSWWINVSILDLNEKRILKIMEYWFNCMWIV